jgi:hypothetical protein
MIAKVSDKAIKKFAITSRCSDFMNLFKTRPKKYNEVINTIIGITKAIKTWQTTEVTLLWPKRL